MLKLALTKKEKGKEGRKQRKRGGKKRLFFQLTYTASSLASSRHSQGVMGISICLLAFFPFTLVLLSGKVSFHGDKISPHQL